MKRQLAIEAADASPSSTVKDEPSTPPSSGGSPLKKTRKSPGTPSRSTPSKTAVPNGYPGSLARSAKGRYMELLFEAGIKAINKKGVQEEVCPCLTLPK